MTLRYHDGQSYLEGSETHPYPVKVMADPAARSINGSTKQIVVGTAITLILAANPKRVSAKITNITGTQISYIGFSEAITSSTGDYLHSAAGSNTTIYAKGPIWGIAITAAQTVSVMEEEWAEDAGV